MNNGKNYLGIDWGSAKIGIAMAHVETGIALTYATIGNDSRLLSQLGEIITKEEIGTVVIGIPVHISLRKKSDEIESEVDDGIEYEGKKLGEFLSERFSVRVEYLNEMFTTKMAQAHLIERGETSTSKHDDEEAARIILQEWLDMQKKTDA